MPQTSDAGRDAEDEPRAEEEAQVAQLGAYDRAVLEIGFWRGYVKAEFVAIVRDRGAVWAAARSPSFFWRGRGAPPEDHPHALAAYERLLEGLAEEGWEPVSGGRPWYAYGFRRRLENVSPLSAAPPPGKRTTRATADDPAG